jgi:hypothetical protein
MRRANTASVTDIVFVLLTIAAFALIAWIGKAGEKL